MIKFFAILINATLISNIILAKFLGICSYIGVSKRQDTAFGMGMAVTFVMTMATAITWPIFYYFLKPLDMMYLKTISFILVIAVLVQLVEIVMKKIAPALYSALGIYLPLIATNCAILGVAILSIQNNYSFLEAVFFAFSVALGYTLAIVLFSAIRERLELKDLPESVKGAPIAFITAGLMSLSFMGFAGLDKFLK